MRELSLNVLDVAQNSVAAQAAQIESPRSLFAGSLGKKCGAGSGTANLPIAL